MNSVAAKYWEINAGKKCTLHFRKFKTESSFLQRGRLKLRVITSPDSSTIEECELAEGDCSDIPPGLVRRMQAIEYAELFEFLTQHFVSDSYRLIKGD